MKRISFTTYIRLFFGTIFLFSCTDQKIKIEKMNTRHLVDTVGFTQYNRQFDSIIQRIDPEDKKPSKKVFKAAICPHDDYAYAAGLYSKTLSGIKAKTIILIGVAHKARKFDLENKLVFGSFDLWKCNDDVIPVSPIRDELLKQLPKDIFIVHDSMMQLEHSLEAINPFLKRNIKDLEIIPVLVPYMTYEKMDAYAGQLAAAVYKIMKEKNLKYGEDLAVVISNDAIHYGNTEWGGSDLAPFGVDSTGIAKAKQKDLKIIEECLKGKITDEKIKKFNTYTVDTNNFKKYRWTWCGRYSVPFGLLFANKLNILIDEQPLTGTFLGYRSSYPGDHIEVKDLGMGTTAPATHSHWVSYAGIGYQ